MAREAVPHAPRTQLHSMYTQRRISDDERKLISDEIRAKRSPDSPWRTILGGIAVSLVAAAFAGVPLLLLMYLIRYLPKPLPRVYFYGIVPLTMVAVATWLFRFHLRDARRVRSWMQSMADDLERTLQAGVVETWRVHPLDVVTIDEPADGYDQYMFRLDGDRCLILRETDYELGLILPMERTMPTDDFEIVRLPQSKRIIGLYLHGNPMTSTAILDERLDKHQIPSGDPVSAPWDDVLNGNISV